MKIKALLLPRPIYYYKGWHKGKKINQLVYKLYGLTKKEIKIVERVNQK